MGCLSLVKCKVLFIASTHHQLCHLDFCVGSVAFGDIFVYNNLHVLNSSCACLLYDIHIDIKVLVHEV